MSLSGHYYRPGLSVVTVARAAEVSPENLHALLAKTVPLVDQLCIVVDSGPLAEVTQTAGPKVCCQLVPSWATERAAWEAAAKLAEHDWSFMLLHDELLEHSDFAMLRRALPHAVASVVVVADESQREVQVRAWRTGWSMSPDGRGQTVRYAPVLTPHGGCVELHSIAREPLDLAAAPAQSPIPQRGAALICGMHRSGTSMITRVINLLGLSLGDNLAGVHTPAHSSNAKGHWESLDAQDVHKQMLREALSLRSDWEWFHDINLLPQHVSPENQNALRAFARRMSERGRWALKDPRVSLMLPVWRNLLPDACFVCCVRDPLSVALSLHARDEIPLVDGLRIWRAYNLRVLESTSQCRDRTLFVSYEKLLTKRDTEVQRMARFLGLDPSLSEQVSAEIAAFVEPDMRHHAEAESLRATIEQAMAQAAATHEVEELMALYAHLQRLCQIEVAAPESPSTSASGGSVASARPALTLCSPQAPAQHESPRTTSQQESSMTESKRVRIYQIYYNQETRQLVEPEFIALDNTHSERSDWAEYWPIRRVLQTERFDEDALIGFFSPRFREKTGMSGAAVVQALQAREAEIYSFSPYIEHCALYNSPFHQGETVHAGLVELMNELMPLLGLSIDAARLISDTTSTIYCNYFVARPHVWQRWLALCEKLFTVCEQQDSPLGAKLRAPTNHRGENAYNMKVFVLERLITLLIEAEGLSALPCLDVRTMPRSLPYSDKVLGQLLMCDALKGQYRRTRSMLYLDLFEQVRQQILQHLRDTFAAQKQGQAQVQAPQVPLSSQPAIQVR